MTWSACGNTNFPDTHRPYSDADTASQRLPSRPSGRPTAHCTRPIKPAASPGLDCFSIDHVEAGCVMTGRDLCSTISALSAHDDGNVVLPAADEAIGIIRIRSNLSPQMQT